MIPVRARRFLSSAKRPPHIPSNCAQIDAVRCELTHRLSLLCIELTICCSTTGSSAEVGSSNIIISASLRKPRA